MAASGDNKSCVKCQKAFKNTEIVLVCGLWCRKSFHSYCAGLSNYEAQALMYSKERIKFHCETCENKLGMELFGRKETHEHKQLENSVNSCLLELLQKIFKLTNELSSDNSVINTKLDTVLSSNARMEDYLLQSPLSNDNSVLNTKLDTVISSNARMEEYLVQSSKCFEKQSGETTDNSVEYVGSDCTKGITEIRERHNTNSHNHSASSKGMKCCVSELQQTDNRALHIAEDFPEQSTDSQQNVAEGWNSNCLQQWELPNDHNRTQDPLSTIKLECSPPEDFLNNGMLTIEKTEGEEDEEKVISKENMEECSSSGDFIGPNTFNTEETEYEEDEEAVEEDDLEDLRHEVMSISSDSETESTSLIGLEDNKTSDGSDGLVTNISLAAGTGDRIQYTTNQAASCDNKIGTRHLHSCSVCRKTFTSSSLLKRHFLGHNGERPNICDVCNKTFRDSTALKKHLQLHSRERPYTCGVCNKTYTQKSNLKNHLRLHTGERNSCAVSKNKFALTQELQERHELQHVCSVCHKAFATRFILKRHFRIHTGERPYICDVCNKTFRDSTALKNHLRLHSGERPYTCGVCNKTYTQKSNLKNHLRLHTGERNSCAVSKNKFALLQELQERHELQHVCSVCHKAFASRFMLKRHFRIHTGEQPYKCGICNRAFDRSCYLKQHYLIHTSKHPYSCGICNKTFLMSAQLNLHLLLHTDERPQPVKCVINNKEHQQAEDPLTDAHG